MSIPPEFASALAQRQNESIWWLEIAGIPVCFGTRSKSSSFFSSRSAREQFDSIKPWLVVEEDGIFDPQLSAQEVDYFEGRVNIQTGRIVISDVDGTLAGYCGSKRTSGWMRVSSDVTATATTIPYSGTAPGASGTAYVGRETFTYTGSASNEFTGVTRGLYKSPRQEHAGTTTANLGEIITSYPRGLEDRRCFLYYGLDAADATKAVRVFAGYVRATGWQNGGRELVLSLDDGQGALARRIFTDLGETFSVRQGFTGGVFRFSRNRNFTQFTLTAGGCDFAGSNGDIIYIHKRGAFGDCIGAFKRDTSNPDDSPGFFDAFTYIGNALVIGAQPPLGDWSTPKVVALIDAYRPDTVTEGVKFTAGNHPLKVALQIMLSSGVAGENHSTFDTLPAAWGCALTSDDVDVEAFTKAYDDTNWLKLRTAVFEPVDAREFIVKECLRPFGWYLKPTFDGRIGLGRLVNTTPDTLTDMPLITADDLAVDPQTGQIIQLDGPESHVDKVVAGIAWSDSPVLTNGKWEPAPPVTVRVVENVASREEFANGRIVEIETLGLHGQQSATVGGVRAEPSSIGTNQLAQLVTRYQFHFARPPQVVTAAIKITRLLGDDGGTLDVGDLVSVTLPSIVDAATGTRGLSAVVHEVFSKRWDVKRGLVIFELARTGGDSIRTRYIAPTCDVTAWDSGTKTLTVSQNAYSPSPRADTNAFAAGDEVRLYRSDYGTRFEAVGIVSKTSTTIVLDAVPTGYTFSAGDILTAADYTEAVSAQKSSSAFRADNAETLDSDSAHTHS